VLLHRARLDGEGNGDLFVAVPATQCDEDLARPRTYGAQGAYHAIELLFGGDYPLRTRSGVDENSLSIEPLGAGEDK
jgi:hypothetical protein